MTTLVCGSRSIKSYSIVTTAINSAPFSIHSVINGGADGVDSIAEPYAKMHGIEVETIKPDYETYGDRAPLERNKTMVSEADKLIAVWDGESTGTKHTIEVADEEGMSTIESTDNGDWKTIYMEE